MSRMASRPVQANLTPMIDVIFLLIVFFVLVSQIVDIETADMTLPAPQDPASQLPGDEQRLVINVLPGPDGRAAGYRVGGRTLPPDPARLTAFVHDQYARTPRDEPLRAINLRADRSTRYESVHPALEAVREAARRAGRGRPPRVNLVVVREGGGG